ncbi:MAG: glycosyltransferase family 4 protein [Anaerolineae bacterium]|nr:glycosyltransferase family 4 protein [Anaerolineae bacterium]
MRIGILSAEYPPLQGGVGDYSRQLARALAELGHAVHVLTGRAGESQPVPPDASFAVHRVVAHWRWGCWRDVLRVASELELDGLNLQFQTAAYGMHPAIQCPPRRREPALLVTFHDLKAPYLFPKAGPLRWQSLRWLARRADGVIVTNREDWLRLAGDCPAGRLRRIPIGSNIACAPPAGYDRDAERAAWGVGRDDLLLGYFGFLNESKGGEELVEATALLAARGLPVHLLMVGGRVGSSDPTNRAYAGRVERLIADRGLQGRVHWTGYGDPAAVSAGLLATDVCVLPYRDGVSFRRGTLLACLAHHRAVVTTRPAVPLPEVRDGENMLLAPPRDAADLAAAVARLADDPPLRERLQAGAAELAAAFSWESIARQLAAFLEGLRG